MAAAWRRGLISKQPDVLLDREVRVPNNSAQQRFLESPGRMNRRDASSLRPRLHRLRAGGPGPSLLRGPRLRSATHGSNKSGFSICGPPPREHFELFRSAQRWKLGTFSSIFNHLRLLTAAPLVSRQDMMAPRLPLWLSGIMDLWR